jgi:transcription elongation factor GreA
MRVPRRKKEDDRRALAGDDELYVTQKGFDKMRAQILRLQSALPELRDELTAAREMGDLSENAAYSIAKANLRRTQNRILRLQEDIKRAIIIERPVGGVIDVGSVVTVDTASGSQTFEIVGSRESNPMQDRISFTSPLGAALRNHGVGEYVTVEGPQGKIDYKIVNIE